MPTLLNEIQTLRERRAKHFETDVPGEYVARLSFADVHYEKPDGSWDDVANMVQATATGWAADTKDVRFAIESGFLSISYKGRALTMRPSWVGMVDRTAPSTRWRKLADASYAHVTRSGDTITVTDIFPNVDLVVRITQDEMEKAFHVRVKPTLPDPTSLGWNAAQTYLVFVWEVNVPAGAVVKDAVTEEVVASEYVGNNDLRVDTSGGDPVVYFAKGVARSATGRTAPVWYVVASSVPFGEAVPYARVQIATYPLVVDPTAYVNPGAYGRPYLVQTLDYGGSRVTTEQAPVYAGRTTYYDGKDTWNVMSMAWMRFDLSTLSGATVSAAALQLHNGWSTASQTKSGTSAAAWESWSLTASDVEASAGNVLVLRVSGNLTPNGATDQLSADDAYLDVTYTDVGVVILGITASQPTGTSPAVTMPSRIQSGELLLAVIGYDGQALTTPSGWTRIGSDANNVAMFYRLADGTESSTYTWSRASFSNALEAVVFRLGGVDTGTPIDVTRTNGSAGTHSGVTTTVDKSLVVAAAGDLSEPNWYRPDLTVRTNWAPDTTGGILGAAAENAGSYLGVYCRKMATAGATGTTQYWKSGYEVFNLTPAMVAVRARTVTHADRGGVSFVQEGVLV
jgi:hypothetical protein